MTLGDPSHRVINAIIKLPHTTEEATECSQAIRDDQGRVQRHLLGMERHGEWGHERGQWG